MKSSILVGIAIALVLILPLAWKWQLGVRRVAVFLTFTGVMSGLLLVLPGLEMPFLMEAGLVTAITVTISTGFLAFRFYRDPERSPTSTKGAVISPADGIIVYVKSSEQGQLPVTSKHGRHCSVSELLKTSFYSSDAWVIGISMSLLDVHVNRAPIAGRVTFQKHFPGKFGSLRIPEREFDNERATTIIQGNQLQVAVVQIASRLVRQIVPYVKAGEQLALGQRIGAIRFGSQVDLILPASSDLNITIQPGAQVKAGETVLATYNTRYVSENVGAVAQPAVHN